MNPLDIAVNILQRVTGRGIRQAAEDTRALGQAGQKVNSDGYFRRIQRDLAAIGAEIPGFSRLQRIIGVLTSGPLAAVAAGVAGITVAIRTATRAIREFAAAEVAFDRLDAALLSSGQLTQENRQRLEELAGTYQRLTGIADGEWLSVLQRLIQYGADPRSIGMDLEVVKNLTGLVGDLNTATTLYTRALEGDFSALRRYAIQIDATATQTERMIQLQRAAARGAGILEAETAGLTGAQRRLRNEVSDLYKAMGQTGGADRLSRVLDYYSRHIQNITRALPTLTDKTSKLSEEQSRQNAILIQTDRAMEAARRAAQALATEGQELLASQTNDANNALERQLANTARLNRLLDEQTRAEEGLALAKLDSAQATGDITAEEAAAQRAAIRARNAETIRNRAQAGISGEIDARTGAISDREARLSDLTETQGQAQVAAERAQSALNFIQNRADDIPLELIEAARLEASELRAQYEAISEAVTATRAQIIAANAADKERVAILQQELDLRRQIDATQSRRESIDQATAALPRDRQAAIAAEGQRLARATGTIAQNISARAGGSTAFTTEEERSRIRSGAQSLSREVQGLASGAASGDEATIAMMMEALEAVKGSLERDVASRGEITRLQSKLASLEATIRDLRNRN